MDSGTIWGSSEKGLRADQEGEEATEDGMALNGEGIGVKGADAVQLSEPAQLTEAWFIAPLIRILHACKEAKKGGRRGNRKREKYSPQ